MNDLSQAHSGALLSGDPSILCELRLAVASTFDDPVETRRRLESLIAFLHSPSFYPNSAPLPSAKPAHALAPWQAKRVHEFVEKNLDRPLSVQLLADTVRLSVSYFFRAFRGSFGMAPHSFIMQCRIERAQELLKFGDEPIAQVAITCGFCDQAHFSRTFAKRTGLPPAAWRRVHGYPHPSLACDGQQPRSDVPASA